MSDLQNKLKRNNVYHMNVMNPLLNYRLSFSKIYIIEVYLLNHYFESHVIYKWCYYNQTISNRLNIMVSYVDIMGLCQSVAILLEIYRIWPLNVIWGGITYISSECKLRDFLNRFSFLPSFIWWREKKTITMSYIRLHFLINQSWIMFITLYTLLDLMESRSFPQWYHQYQA